MKILSCGARDNNIYMVINVPELHPCSNESIFNVPWFMPTSNDCPPVGYFIYNTEVVFNRQGIVIAR